jgi:DNA-binding MarR family transcriptional regulator
VDLRQLAKALQSFAVLEPTQLPLHFLQVFLVVAECGPCTYRRIEERLNLTNSSVSRTLNALAETHRSGRNGFGLVVLEQDPAEGRRFQARLSARGEALRRQLESL